MHSVSEILVFRSGDLRCALPLETVQEIVPIGRLLRPPSLPLLLAGILNLRGTAVPILRLDKLFGGAEDEPGLYTPLVILREAHRPLGILVSAVDEIVLAPPETRVEADPSHTLNGCTKATVEVGGHVVHLLSTERILLENERRLLDEFQVAAQRRMREWEALS
jgi:purine-binding chemotaxis protein CheW